MAKGSGGTRGLVDKDGGGGFGSKPLPRASYPEVTADVIKRGKEIGKAIEEANNRMLKDGTFGQKDAPEYKALLAKYPELWVYQQERLAVDAIMRGEAFKEDPKNPTLTSVPKYQVNGAFSLMYLNNKQPTMSVKLAFDRNLSLKEKKKRAKAEQEKTNKDTLQALANALYRTRNLKKK